MQKNHEVYYQPYVSDSEDSKSTSSDSSSITSSDSTDTRESMYEDPITSKKFLTQLGGINLDPPEKQIELLKKKGIEYSIFDLSGVNASLPGTGTSFNMVDGTYTSILMINSRDRDNQVYPQPTLLTLRLPRTYRNIVSFQITQMKLLSSFFYFRPDKQNVSLEILEQGRTLIQNGQTVDNIITVTIRTGSYDINSLLTEIQTQLNKTPLFFYYPNGFSDFITLFTSTGNLGINFNQPGDTFYNPLTKQFIANPTLSSITTTFFASQYAGLTTYTLSQVKIAYYYPVLYEMLLDPQFSPTLDLTLSPTAEAALLPGETVQSRIIYTFQGLNDVVVLDVINTNLNILYSPGVTILDNFRTLNTFKYSLVNEYKATYQTNNNRIVIATSQLNTSLTNLLNQQTTAALISVLNSLNLTLQQYSNLIISNSLFTAVFGGMYNFNQSNFANYFAVNFGTYTPVFYTNVSNAPFLQNGINATGVANGYSLQLLQSAEEPISSSSENLKSSPGYWPQIKTSPVDSSNNVIFVGAGLGNRQQDISATFLNVPYNTYSGSVLTTEQFIDNSGNVYISPTFGAGDCITPIYNSKYTVFRFRSFVRQTLQVETLPLPYYYRYPPITGLNYTNPIPQYFDLSYSYVNSPYLVRTDISNISLTFGESYATARASVPIVEFSVRDPVKYYSFVAPSLQYADASGCKYPLTIAFESVDALDIGTKYKSPMNFFLYHDQGAFYADISGYRNESPYNYKYTTEGTVDISRTSIQFNAIGGNRYYIIGRSSEVSFQNTRVKTFVYYPDGGSTLVAKYFYDPFVSPTATPTISFPIVSGAKYNILYAGYYDADFVRLPTASNLQGPDPSSQVYNKFLPISQSALTPIGYDISGVSNDLTDYRGFSNGVLGNDPNTTFSVDPMTKYTFQSLSPYNAQTSNYFYTGGSNALLQPITNIPYVPKTVNERQFKIVNWYDTNYLPPQGGQQALPTYGATQLANAKVFDASYGVLSVNLGTPSATIGTTNLITYDASGNEGQATGGLNMGNGVAAFGFLPNEGTWDVENFVFKSAFMELDPLASNYVADPNRRISRIGIFPTNLITGLDINDITISSAIAVLKYNKHIKYTPAVQTINSGFDTVGGTYWEYTIDTTFTKSNTLAINGYTPSVTYSFNSNNYYSLLAFDSSGVIVPFYTPMGSYVPYPKVTQPTLQSTYTDTYGTYTANVGEINGINIYQRYYIPTCNIGYNSNDPATSNFYPQDGNIYQSRYQQSIPIKTSLIQTLLNSDFWTSSNALYVYPTDPSVTSTITNAYSFLTEDPILAFTKGPYFFWYTTENLLTANLIITSNLNTANNVSNVSIRNTAYIAGPTPLQSISTTGNFTPFLASTIIGSSNSNVFLGFTTNRAGTTDESGIYGLFGSYYPSVNAIGCNGTSYCYGFFVSRLNFNGNNLSFTRMTTTLNNPDFYSGQYSNAIGPEINSNFTNLYTDNYTFTKFFFSGVEFQGQPVTYVPVNCMLMYTTPRKEIVDVSSIVVVEPKSFWVLAYYSARETDTVEVQWVFDAFVGTSNTYGVRDDIIRCFNPNGYDPTNTDIYTGVTTYYWNKTTPEDSNTIQSVYYPFDWALGEDGYVNVLTNTAIGAQLSYDTRTDEIPVSFQIFRASVLSNFSGLFSNNGYTIYSSQFLNTSANQPFNTSPALYNQLCVDISNNFYLQAGVPPNFTSNMYPNSLVNYGLSPINNSTITATSLTPWLNFARNPTSQFSFLKIPASAINRTTILVSTLQTYTPSNYTFTEGGTRPQDAINVCVTPIEPTQLDSQFPFYANRVGNAQNTSIDWFPLISQTITVPYYKTQSQMSPPVPPPPKGAQSKERGRAWSQSQQGIYIQAANKQFFWTETAKLNITDASGLLLIQSDISGTYDIDVSLVSTLGGGGYSSTLTTYIEGIPAGATTSALNTYWSKYAVNPDASDFYFNFCDIQFQSTLSKYSYSLLPKYTNTRGLSQQTLQVKNANVINKQNGRPLSVSIQNIAVGSNDVSMDWPPVYGNSGLTGDTLAPIVTNVWNAFYPTMKLILTKSSANAATPITNTYDLIGNPPPPYDTPEHTSMFYYDNYTDMSRDLYGKFGQESATRFKAVDISSGYGFHSYIYNIPLSAYTSTTRDISGNTGYNYLAIRGYSPTEKFDCLTRFYLPKRYDFGFISLQDLSNECQTVLVDLSGSPLVNPTYQTVLNAFNNAYKGTFTFGSNAIAGFVGSNYTLTGWPSFLRTYINTYNSGTSNANLLAYINSQVTVTVANYIKKYLSDILPSYVLTRARFTDPLLYSILFKSALSDEVKNLEYEWGLGWNLGYPKEDTPYDTIQRATSFFKILDDYIYLKMNNEFMMNRLDSSGPENYSITHDATGQTNQYTAKLLLAPFGSYAQTMIQNPIMFNPVLTSIDRLTFQWVDLTNTTINNEDCEWNAAVQIVEQVTTASASSTIPKAPKPKG